jgi:AraC-like DNA-binding protein
MSHNYPPSPALRPYVKQHYVFKAELPADFELVDQLLSETAFVRILAAGDWSGEYEPGVWSKAGPVVLFGANARPVRVRVCGSFNVIGFAVRPAGWRALFGCSASKYADRMVPLSDVWGESAQVMHQNVVGLNDDVAIVAAMEAVIAEQLGRFGPIEPDSEMAEFDRIARHESTIRVNDAATQLGLPVRQMERRCVAAFGHMPKTILRRSRFLDMATVMRGFGDTSQDELAALRYFDQSHRNREFRRFINMTPGQFERTPTPLLTAGLKLRSEQR